MRSYVYTVKSQQWPLLSPREGAIRVCDSLVNPLGVEAVEFYLTTIDRGEADLLTELARIDLEKFVQIVTYLDLRSSIVQDVRADHQQTALLARLYQYACAYSEITRRYLPDLCERLEPYTTAEVGVWVNRSMYQLRARTPQVPQPVALVDDQVAAALFGRTASMQVYAALQPGGTLHIGLNDITDKLPQKFAWEHVSKQIADLCTKRLLDESSSPQILQERIWETLLYEPSVWFEGTPVGRRFWEEIGFARIQDLENASLDDLLRRVNRLYDDYRGQIPRGVELGRLEPHQRWYYLQSLALRRAYYWLDLLTPLKQQLEAPKADVEDLFGYLHSHDFSTIIHSLSDLVPDILSAYRSIVFKNFSQIGDRFAFLELLNCPMLLEITHDSSQGDFLTLTYVLLPSVDQLSQTPLIYSCPANESIANVSLTKKTLKGTWQQRAIGARFGRTSVSRRIGDLQIVEPNAAIICTRFPSRQPILDQVYQLVGCELQHLLGENLPGWHNLDYAQTNTDSLDEWINRYFALRSTPGRA